MVQMETVLRISEVENHYMQRSEVKSHHGWAGKYGGGWRDT